MVTPDKRCLTDVQVAELAAAAGDYGLAVRVLAYRGIRFGELAALRVGWVDLMRRRLHTAEAMTEVGGRAIFGAPQDHQCRSVPVTRSIAGDLAVHVAGRRLDELVFTAPAAGRSLRMPNFRRRVFDRAAREAGLEGSLHTS